MQLTAFAAVAFAVAILASNVAGAASLSCQGVRVAYSDATATYSFAAAELKAFGTTCAIARKVARAVVTPLLHGETPAKVIDGFAIHLAGPCRVCTPVWKVRATKQGAVITFVGRGGA